MRQTFERVFLDTNGKVAVLTLNHDATINALSTAMVESLNAALDVVETGGFRALVLTGADFAVARNLSVNELTGAKQPSHDTARWNAFWMRRPMPA